MTSIDNVSVAIPHVLLLAFALRVCMVTRSMARRANSPYVAQDRWFLFFLTSSVVWFLTSVVCFVLKITDSSLLGVGVELVALLNALLLVATLFSVKLRASQFCMDVPSWFWTAAIISTLLLGAPLGSEIEWFAHILRVVMLWLLAVATSLPRTSPQPIFNPEHLETFHNSHDSPLVGASFWERYSFSWINPILRAGLKQRLEPDHIYDIPLEHRVEQSRAELLPVWNAKLEAGVKEGALTRSMYSAWGKEFWFAGFFHLLEIPCIFINPVLLNLLIKYYSDPEAPFRVGFCYTFGLMVGNFLSSFFSNHFQIHMSLLGIRAQGATGALVFEKALRLSQPAAQVHTAGKVASIINVDCDRLGFAAYFAHFIWSMPLIFIIAMYLIWIQLGVSCLASVGVMLLLVPANKKIVKMWAKYSQKISERRDKRVNTFKEINSAVKFVKLLTWEEKACGLINAKRDVELNKIKGMKNVWILGQFLFVIIPLILPVFAFVMFYFVSEITGKPLDTAEAFTALAVFDVLFIPINLIPITTQFLAQMYVSMQRIESLLFAEERHQGQIEPSPTAPPETEGASSHGKFSQVLPSESNVDAEDVGKMCLENAEVRWDPVADEKDEEEDEEDPSLTRLAIQRLRERRRRRQQVLEGVQVANTPAPPTLVVPALQIPKGLLTIVCGRVGQGKSTLLAALLNEVPLVEGSISVVGSTCYCPQQAWIMHGTVRSNILFNQPMDRVKYINVIKACALSRDICSFEKKDLEMVGERGITLSGGQKARVQLARSVYADKDIALLDDVLSAVDAHVGTQLMQNVILGKGALAGKTRVLVTHQTQWLPYADCVVSIVNGKVAGVGTYAQLAKEGLVDKVGEIEDQHFEGEDEIDIEAVIAPIKSDGEDGDDEDEREEGAISLRIWKMYAVSLGSRTSVIIMTLFLLAEVASLLANIVLSHWTAKGSSGKTANSLLEMRVLQPLMALARSPLSVVSATAHALVGYSMDEFSTYVIAYSALLIAAGACITIRNVIMRDASINLSRKLHKDALWAVVRAPMEWHDTTPNGRKINRFTADLQKVDEELQFVVMDFIRCVCLLLTSLVVVVVLAPLALVTISCVAVVYYYLQRIYRSSARELQRLTSMAQSPVSQRLDEAISGKATINAKHESGHFCEDNVRRMNTVVGRSLVLQAGERWLSLRLSSLNALITFTLGMVFLFKRSSDADQVSLLALSLKYALSMGGQLNGLIQGFIFVELGLVALERVDTYANLDSEAALTCVASDSQLLDGSSLQLIDSPSSTDVGLEFKDVVMRYRLELPPALKGCSFRIPKGHSVGVVGRTGAGKTSLLAAAFRLHELDGGQIFVDGKDIGKLGLHDLRAHMAIIPQDPVLFACPLRQNLDPWNEHSDDVLVDHLRSMKLDSLLEHQDGLQMAIASDGGNLSVGQRQLLCLARALLRQTSIFFLDEATASIDKQTDEVIQQTLRSNADSRTVTLVTIAHRLETVLSAHFILTMDDGKVAEFGPTVTLAKDPESKFASFLSRAKLTGDTLQDLLFQHHGKDAGA